MVAPAGREEDSYPWRGGSITRFPVRGASKIHLSVGCNWRLALPEWGRTCGGSTGAAISSRSRLSTNSLEASHDQNL